MAADSDTIIALRDCIKYLQEDLSKLGMDTAAKQIGKALGEIDIPDDVARRGIAATLHSTAAELISLGHVGSATHVFRAIAELDHVTEDPTTDNVVQLHQKGDD